MTDNILLSTDWQYAWTQPQVQGDFKSKAQDFFVEEQLDFMPDETGEHLYLFIEKQGVNTEYLAKLLAKYADIDGSKVTYSGVKDRHAITRQWFCLHVLNKKIDFSGFNLMLKDALAEGEQVSILKQHRHSKKLRIGSHQKNNFIIRIRNLQGSQGELEDRLKLIALEGVPNYFGPQRFGINDNNLVQGVKALFAGKLGKRKLTKTESFWLSALRSWFFNQALSEQVNSGIWNKVFIEDRVQVQGSSSQLKLKEINALVLKQLQSLELQPLMPLINGSCLQDTSSERSQSMSTSWKKTAEVETKMMALGLAREDRMTRLLPENMQWEIKDSELILNFSLTKGCFATSVLREILTVQDLSGVEKE